MSIVIPKPAFRHVFLGSLNIQRWWPPFPTPTPDPTYKVRNPQPGIGELSLSHPSSPTNRYSILPLPSVSDMEKEQNTIAEQPRSSVGMDTMELLTNSQQQETDERGEARRLRGEAAMNCRDIFCRCMDFFCWPLDNFGLIVCQPLPLSCSGYQRADPE